MKKAFFLDRDGTLIEENQYISSPEQIEIIDGNFDAIRLMNEAGYLVIIISNQSGVARGYFKEDTVPIINSSIEKIFADKNCTIDAFYYCPHFPEGIVPEYSIICDCRKPKTGLIKQAEKDFDIDLSKSYFIGDRLTDVQCGRNAGMEGILLLTGYGKKALAETNEQQDFRIFNNLFEAMKCILNME